MAGLVNPRTFPVNYPIGKINSVLSTWETAHAP